MDSGPCITFSTCWYQLKAKFSHDVYGRWIANMLSNVRNYNLVVYTDAASCAEAGLGALADGNPRIRIVVKPMESWHNYSRKATWEANHRANTLLAGLVDWRVNMLWSEKVHFVRETVDRKYFDTEWHGWCDIGYFRNRTTGPCGLRDTSIELLRDWPSSAKILALDPFKIHYGRVTNDLDFFERCRASIRDGHFLDPSANLVAGGFFMLHRDNAVWWAATYDAKLRHYFDAGQVVKDDQQIVADCVLSEATAACFCMYHEANGVHDFWFMFQRLLL
jgi:hypothetical protein